MERLVFKVMEQVVLHLLMEELAETEISSKTFILAKVDSVVEVVQVIVVSAEAEVIQEVGVLPLAALRVDILILTQKDLIVPI